MAVLSAVQDRGARNELVRPQALSTPQQELQSTRPARKLPADLQASMQSRFQHDFAHVRVHSDERGADMAAAFRARAVTFGNEIFFGAGQFDPRSARGRRLIAHELTHVVQAGEGITHPSQHASPNVVLEREARAAAAALATGVPMPRIRGVANTQNGPLRNGPDEPTAGTFGNAPTDVHGRTTAPDVPDPRGVRRRGELFKDTDGLWRQRPFNGRARGSYDFVVQEGRIYAVKGGRRVGATWGHTEAAAGGRVEFAGQITFEAGKLVTWSNSSGHYRPSKSFAKAAGAAGLPMDQPPFVPHVRKPGDPLPQLPVIQPGDKEPVKTPAAEAEPAKPPVGDAEPAKPSATPEVGDKSPKPAGGDGELQADASRPGARRGVTGEEGGPHLAGGPTPGQVRAGRWAAGIGAFNVLLALAGMIPDPLDERVIQEKFDAELNSARTQALIAKLAPKVDAKSGAAYYNIRFDVAYEVRQSVKPLAIPTVAHPVGVQITSIDVSSSELNESGAMTPEEKPPNAKPIYGGGYFWEARSSCVTSARVKSGGESRKEASDREKAAIAERLRQIDKRSPPKPAPSASPGPSAGPTPTPLLPGPGGPQPTAEFVPLPGAPGPSKVEEAAHIVANARKFTSELVARGTALRDRTTGSNSPTHAERDAFFADEERWRLLMQYLRRTFEDRSRGEAVNAIGELVDRYGRELSQLRTQLGG